MQKVLASMAIAIGVACTSAELARAADESCLLPVPQPLPLAAAEARLLLCNRELAAARNAFAAAAADRRIAGQRPNPSLTLGASNMNPHMGMGPGPLRDKTFDSSLRIEQLIERGGKPALREQQAGALLEAARADVFEQARQQRLAVRNAFFDLAAAQERVRLQRDFQALAGQSAAASNQRLEAGEVSRAEANRFRLDALRAANDARQAEADRQRARFELARLIGADAFAATLEVAPVWPAPERGAPGSGERPDVLAAQRRVTAAEAARDLARSLATRDVTVGAQADRWPVSQTNFQGTGISYGLTLSIPLQVRHANEGEAARAQADLDSARAVLERARAQAASDALLAEEDWRAARERRLRIESEVGPAARDVAAAAEWAYTRGATGVLDLLDARRSLKTVELDEVAARVEAAKAWARREAAAETIEE